MSGKVTMRIVELLKEKGKQDKDLCDYIGVAQSTFVNWKNRGTDPRPKHLPSIADFFDVTVDYLLTGKDEDFPEERSMNIDERIQALIDDLTGDSSAYCYGEVMSEEGKLALLNSLKQDREFLTALYKKK